MLSKLLDYFGGPSNAGMLYGPQQPSMDAATPQPIDPRQRAMQMQGLLGAATSLLNTSGYSRMPVSSGQRIGAALQGYTEGVNNKAPIDAQTANIDLQSKGNIFATQVLSAATATGDQAAYDKAKSQLVRSGIDLSAWAPDVATAAKQAQAARLAQSPLGSLLNAAGKFDTNNIAANTAAGIATGNPNAVATSLLTNGGFGGGQPTTQSSGQPASQNYPEPVVLNNTPGMTPTEKAAALLPGEPPVITNNVPKFVPPAYDPTKTQTANQQAYQQALEAYKSNPAVIAGNKMNETTAGKEGEAIGEALKTANLMQSNLPMVLQRFENMRKASMQAGYGTGNNNEGTGFLQEFHKNFQNSPTAEANATLQQYAAQGILPELGPQLAQAGIRGNKFLETLASQASGLDLGANPASKLKVINGLENTYINNLKSTAAQLRAKGQAAPSNDEINAMVAQIKKSGFSGAQNPSVGANSNGRLSGVSDAELTKMLGL